MTKEALTELVLQYPAATVVFENVTTATRLGGRRTGYGALRRAVSAAITPAAMTSTGATKTVAK